MQFRTNKQRRERKMTKAIQIKELDQLKKQIHTTWHRNPTY